MKFRFVLESLVVECSMGSFIHRDFRSSFICININVKENFWLEMQEIHILLCECLYGTLTHTRMVARASRVRKVILLPAQENCDLCPYYCLIHTFNSRREALRSTENFGFSPVPTYWYVQLLMPDHR